MTASKATGPIKSSSIQVVLSVWVGSLVVFGLCGCGTTPPPENDSTSNAVTIPAPGSNDPAWLTSREKLPPPDTDRIEYDASSRTLNLYDLPSQDTWMVQLPGESAGRLIGTLHHLPVGIDTKHTLVFYARAGVKTSAPVTVAQIEAGRLGHSSVAIGH